MSSMTQKFRSNDSSSDSEKSFINVLDERPTESSADVPFDDMIESAFACLQDIIAAKNSAEAELDDLFVKRRAHAVEELEKARRRLEFVDEAENRMKNMVKEDCFKQFRDTVASEKLVTMIGGNKIPKDKKKKGNAQQEDTFLSPPPETTANDGQGEEEAARQKAEQEEAERLERERQEELSRQEEEMRAQEEADRIAVQEAKMMAAIEERRAAEAKKAQERKEAERAAQAAKEERQRRKREAKEEAKRLKREEEQAKLQHEREVAEELAGIEAERIAEEEKLKAKEMECCPCGCTSRG